MQINFNNILCCFFFFNVTPLVLEMKKWKAEAAVTSWEIMNTKLEMTIWLYYLKNILTQVSIITCNTCFLYRFHKN